MFRKTASINSKRIIAVSKHLIQKSNKNQYIYGNGHLFMGVNYKAECGRLSNSEKGLLSNGHSVCNGPAQVAQVDNGCIENGTLRVYAADSGYDPYNMCAVAQFELIIFSKHSQNMLLVLQRTFSTHYILAGT